MSKALVYISTLDSSLFLHTTTILSLATINTSLKEEKKKNASPILPVFCNDIKTAFDAKLCTSTKLCV